MKLENIKFMYVSIILITSFILIYYVNSINYTCTEYLDNGFSKITDGLYIGNIEDSSNFQKLKNENIQYIVNVTPDIPIYFPKDFNYCRIPIDDRSDVNIYPYLAPAADYIESNIQKGNVFVHCYAGISRSASIIIAYLILKKNYTYEEAYNLVKSKRHIIHPNPGFNKILKQL